MMEEVAMEYKEPYFARFQVVSSVRESVIKKVSTVKIPNYGLVKEVVSSIGEEVIKEEEPTVEMQDYEHTEQFSDDVKNVIKEENTLKASHLLVKPVLADVKEESTLQPSGYPHNNEKFYDDAKNVIKEEDKLRVSHLLVQFSDDAKNVFKEEDKLRVSHLLVKPLSSDMKEESTLQASGYAHSNDKYCPFDLNTAIKKEIIFKEPQSLLCLLEKQLRNKFSLEQSHYLGNTLLNIAASASRSSHLSPSCASSGLASPMVLESTRFASMSPMEVENYGSVEDFRQCKFNNCKNTRINCFEQFC